MFCFEMVAIPRAILKLVRGRQLSQSRCDMLTSSGGTTYTVLDRHDGSYAVQVFPHTSLPQVIEPFRTAAEAEQWVFEHVTGQGPKLPQYAGPPQTTPGV